MRVNSSSSQAQRGSVQCRTIHHLRIARQRPGVLQPSGAFRRPSDARKRRRAGALQNAAATFGAQDLSQPSSFVIS